MLLICKSVDKIGIRVDNLMTRQYQSTIRNPQPLVEWGQMRYNTTSVCQNEPINLTNVTVPERMVFVRVFLPKLDEHFSNAAVSRAALN